MPSSVVFAEERICRSSVGSIAVRALCAAALAAAVHAAAPPAAAQGTPYLVRGVPPQGGPLTGGGFVALGGTLLFVGADGPHGDELWRTDGTGPGTALVSDIRSGPFGSVPTEIVASRGGVYFAADDGEHGRELWFSDGTAAGTRMVRDVAPGSADGAPELLTPVGSTGLVYFTADDGTHGRELWRSDGTAAGTVLVADIADGPASADITQIVDRDGEGRIFLTARDRQHGHELWSSDGTRGGTKLVRDVLPGPEDSWPRLLGMVSGALLFAATDGAHGYELWRSDGSAPGTALVADIALGEEDSDAGFGGAVVIGDSAFFGACEPEHGCELWRSDGTAPGTRLIKDLIPGFREGNLRFLFQRLIPAGDRFYVWLDRDLGDGDLVELWRSDGTEDGTVLVASPQQIGIEFAAVGELLYFTASSDDAGWALWRSDGTPGGTGPIDLVPGATWEAWLAAGDLAGTLVIEVADAGGTRLWRSDGTASGTTPFTEPFCGMAALNPRLFAQRGEAYLVATDGSHLLDGSQVQSFRLWRTDGTAAGTERLPSSTAFTAVDSVWSPDASSAEIYLTASDGVHGAELWHGDLATGSASMLKDIEPGGEGSYPSEVVRSGGAVFFAAWDEASGRELWRTDGTPAGTTRVADLDPGAGDSSPRELQDLDGTLLFAAEDPSHGRALWRSDGTAAGTSAVADLRPGMSGSFDLTRVGGRVFLFANDGTHGRDLWATDGTRAGTALVKDIGPGSAQAAACCGFAFGDTLLFLADDGVHGVELWRSDGTEAGTTLVKIIFPGPGASSTDRIDWYIEPKVGFAQVGGLVYFMADDGVHGRAPWRTDGTPAGTFMLRALEVAPTVDFCPRIFSCAARYFADVNGIAYFVARDLEHGDALWKSDGTAAGTQLAADLISGPSSLPITSLLNRDGQLLFAAGSEVVWSDLWALTCGNGVLEGGEECDDGARNGSASSCCAGDCRLRNDHFPPGARAGLCDRADGALALSHARLAPRSAPGTADATVRLAGFFTTRGAGADPLDLSRGLAIEVGDADGTCAHARWEAARCTATARGDVRCASHGGRRRLRVAPAAGAERTYAFHVALSGMRFGARRKGPVTVRLRWLPATDRVGGASACGLDGDALVCAGGRASAAGEGGAAGPR